MPLQIKNILGFLLLFIAPVLGAAQELILVGIQPGANFYVHPDEDVAIFSDVNNAGSLGSYTGSQLNFHGQRWTNRSGGRLSDNSAGGMLGSAGNFRFSGNAVQYLNTQANSPTNLSFPNLTIQNSQNVVVEGADLEIRNSLTFSNGHLVLNNRNLVLGSATTLSGYNESRFIVTGNGPTGGFVRRKTNGSSQPEMIFPVGSAIGSYEPLALTYTGIPQTIGARAFENVYDKAIFGIPNTQTVVDRTWNITYSNADPNAVSSVRLQHNQRDEMTGFAAKRMQSFVSRYDGVKELWDKESPGSMTPGSLTSGNPVSSAFINTRLSMKGVVNSEYFSKSVESSSVIAGLRIPEGISPNEDGLNDRFVIQNLSATDKVRIDIYNRWQTLVYRNLDYKNDFSGIGNQNGLVSNELPDGTYYYILNINGEAPIKGHIVINR